ncbi:hypothetical protein Hanom_Chr17g01529871 [Helianthus anomalus]
MSVQMKLIFFIRTAKPILSSRPILIQTLDLLVTSGLSYHQYCLLCTRWVAHLGTHGQCRL